jgi:hypothetical protein
MGAGEFQSEGDGQAAAAGAGVDDHARGAAAGKQLERLLDDQLRLGPRNEDVASHLERQAPELALAEDIRHRFAPAPPGDEGPVRLREDGRLLVAQADDESRTIAAEHLAGKHFGIERRVLGADPGRGDGFTGPGDAIAQGHQADVSAAVASLSFSEVKWPTAASISSSRSPSSAASSWCMVKPRRWSVTRFSLKL